MREASTSRYTKFHNEIFVLDPFRAENLKCHPETQCVSVAETQCVSVSETQCVSMGVFGAFGFLWHDFGLPLAPLGSLWGVLGLPLAVLWCPFDRPGAPVGSLWGTLGCLGASSGNWTSFSELMFTVCDACAQKQASRNSHSDPAGHSGPAEVVS